ncbi:hypothetical protein J5X84_18265 [Streptosporangiaceae bacterium NEAU-GS5]|nr:hypothetical protein [Streptosporangiaceae bacterium NEAU-GS5]
MRRFIPLIEPGLPQALAHRTIEDPVLLAPLALFVIISVAQLFVGLATIRRGGWLAAAAGLAGTAFGAFTAISVYSASGGGDLLTTDLPVVVPWLGALAVIATALSTVAAFRLWAKAYAIVPAIAGLGFLTWFYGWFI